jgi:cardiolipin synthase
MGRSAASPRARRRHHSGNIIADPQVVQSVRQIGAQALSRTSGAPLVEGNRVHILEDADGNYPVWLAAIRAAKRFVYLENYIFEEDEVGIAFAEALADRASAGVHVRLIRDWMGTRTGSSRGFWRQMGAAGVEIRCFNPPRLDSPFNWVSRDHRKMIAIDGKVAFVAGLCISRRWKGDPARNIPPWRDTGLEIRGPAVADVEGAFAQLWETMGDPIPPGERSSSDSIPRAGEVALRVVAGAPSTAGLFRMDQLVAALARRTLWLSDAYFVGVTPYVQALRAAARDGVDVRLLVPNATDLPLLRPLSRSGYRPLLEAGVRIFEWNGSMMHAKTAVVDGRWSRVGSSNLNLASFLGNYELDVAIDDEDLAGRMQAMYERDLQNATEIELTRRRVREVRPTGAPAVPPPSRGSFQRRGGSGSAAAAGAIRVANAVGAAMTNHRVLGPAESQLLVASGLGLVALAVLAAIWPLLAAIPFAVLAFWVGASLLWRASRLAGRRRAADNAAPALLAAVPATDRADGQPAFVDPVDFIAEKPGEAEKPRV